jgi:hypothetical protein
MQSHYGTWMPIKEGATIPLASADSRSLGSGFQRRLWEKHISGKEN